MRNRNTVEFLGIWEQLNNEDFKGGEFETFKKESGLNRFHLTPKKWIDATNATGITSKAGRYNSGTYAHRDIAFEFGTWLSPEFKLLIIKEFQRLKAKEEGQLIWDSRRYLTRINYRLHTDSIKQFLLDAVDLPLRSSTYVYTDEADMLNKIVFGQTASEWRKTNKEKARGGKNQRDFATVDELVILANLESLNAHLVAEGKMQFERLALLTKESERQYKALLGSKTADKSDSSN